VREAAETIAIALSLVAPYTAEDMWEKLGHKPAIANAGWPVIDKSLLGVDNVIAILQVNGKIKDRIEVSPNISKDELEKLAKENLEIKAATAGLTVSKVITVAPKLVNFVV
jgi:leucyl-tRNA synthetase